MAETAGLAEPGPATACRLVGKEQSRGVGRCPEPRGGASGWEGPQPNRAVRDPTLPHLWPLSRGGWDPPSGGRLTRETRDWALKKTERGRRPGRQTRAGVQTLPAGRASASRVCPGEPLTKVSEQRRDRLLVEETVRVGGEDPQPRVIALTRSAVGHGDRPRDHNLFSAHPPPSFLFLHLSSRAHQVPARGRPSSEEERRCADARRSRASRGHQNPRISDRGPREAGTLKPLNPCCRTAPADTLLRSPGRPVSPAEQEGPRPQNLACGQPGWWDRSRDFW